MQKFTVGFTLLLSLAGCSSWQSAPHKPAANLPLKVEGNTRLSPWLHTTASANIDKQNAQKERQEVAQIDDLWVRIANQLSLPQVDNSRVKVYENWYKKHPSHLLRVSERAKPYLYEIVTRIEARGLPMELALLPIVESAFDPFAYSHGSASGMWQFTAPTAKQFGLKLDWWYDGRRDVLASTDAALDLMTYLHKRFNGDWLHALASYNTGEGRVKRAIRKNRANAKPTDFWALKLPTETKRYVPQLIALAKVVSNPEKYGITLSQIPNRPQIIEVDTGSQIDLAMAAELAGMSLTDLQRLNPGFNRWATSPQGPHHLVVPIEKADQFKAGLASTPSKDRLHWERYQIQSGDSLGEIASKFNSSIDVIRSVNRIKGNQIVAGKHLLIPVASKSASKYTLSLNQRIKKQQNKARAKYRTDYTVKSGDSFWTIAKQHKVSVSSLAKWNNMAPRDKLKIGKKLVIWSNEAVSRSSVNAIHRNIYYKVRSGDSLARIANKFNVTIAQLKRWNTLKEKYIQPGQMLKLIVDVTKVSS